MQDKTKRIALSGILAALTVAILLLGAMIELIDLSAASLAALFIMVAVVEMGNGWACGVYAVSAVLGVLLFPQTATITFAAFLGYYPILKVYLDKIRPRLLQYFIKLALFNGFLTVGMKLCVWLLGTENEWAALGWALYLLGNLTFLVFDFAIGQLSIFYIVKIQSRIRRK